MATWCRPYNPTFNSWWNVSNSYAYATGGFTGVSGNVDGAKVWCRNTGASDVHLIFLIWDAAVSWPGNALLGSSDPLTVLAGAAAAYRQFTFAGAGVAIPAGKTLYCGVEQDAPIDIGIGTGSPASSGGYYVPAGYPTPASNPFYNGLGGWAAMVDLGVGVAVPAVPVAAYTYSKATMASLAVSFQDASTGVPTSWDWNFGDGTTHGTTQNPTHTYAAQGTYTVTLTVTNSLGSSSVSYTVAAGFPPVIQATPGPRQIAGFSALTDPTEVIVWRGPEAPGATLRTVSGDHMVRQPLTWQKLVTMPAYLRPGGWMPIVQPPDHGNNTLLPMHLPLTASLITDPKTVTGPPVSRTAGMVFGVRFVGRYSLPAGAGAPPSGAGPFKLTLDWRLTFDSHWLIPTGLSAIIYQANPVLRFGLRFGGRWKEPYVQPKTTFKMLLPLTLQFGMSYPNPTIYEVVVSPDPVNPPPTDGGAPPDPGDEPVAPPEPDFPAEVAAANISVSFTENTQDTPDWTEIG